MEQEIRDGALPTGFAAALARDPDAMDAFSSLDSRERRRVAEKSKNVRSREEMQAYVSSLVGFCPPNPPIQQ